MKRCKYMGCYSRRSVKQCSDSTEESFCTDHLNCLHLKFNNINIISMNECKYGDLYLLYNTQSNQFSEMVKYEKSWLGLRLSNEGIKLMNIFNYAHHKYKKCIKRWVTMFLVFKHYMGDEAHDVYSQVSDYYLT